MAAQSPPRQNFARIPLALPEMKQRSGSPSFLDPAKEGYRACSLKRPHCVAVPLGTVRFVDPNKGRLAAHRQTYVPFIQVPVHLSGDLLDRSPVFFRVGLLTGGSLSNPAHPHGVAERNSRGLDRTRDRGGIGGFGS